MVRNGEQTIGISLDIVEISDGSQLVTEDSGNLIYRMPASCSYFLHTRQGADTIQQENQEVGIRFIRIKIRKP